MTNAVIVDLVRKELPGFVKHLDESISYNDGDIMLYDIFNRLVKYYIEQIGLDKPKEKRKIEDLLINFLGKNVKELDELVLFGFLEKLPNYIDDYSSIKKTLPLVLLEKANEIDSWWECDG